MVLQKPQRQLGQAPLLGKIHRLGGPTGVRSLGAAHLDEDDAGPIDGDDVDLAELVAMIPADDSIAEASQEALGGALGACAEPAAPQGLSGSALIGWFAVLHVPPFSCSLHYQRR